MFLNARKKQILLLIQAHHEFRKIWCFKHFYLNITTLEPGCPSWWVCLSEDLFGFRCLSSKNLGDTFNTRFWWHPSSPHLVSTKRVNKRNVWIPAVRTHPSGQFITTSAEVTLNGGLVRESSLKGIGYHERHSQGQKDSCVISSLTFQLHIDRWSALAASWRRAE